MNCSARTSVDSVLSPQLGWPKRCRVSGGMICLLILTGMTAAQSPARVHGSAGQTVTARSDASNTELAIRIRAADEARASRDPAAIAQANQRLIATALRELGDLRSVESAYLPAIELYQSSLKFEDDARTRLSLATADSQAGRYDEAIRLAEEIRSTDPTSLRADRVLASSLVQKGEFARAVPVFERIAAAQPDVPNLYALANCLLQTRTAENKVRAQTVFEQIKRLAGNSGSLHVLMGRAYRDASDLDSAVREFEMAIAIDPRTPHAHYFLGLAKLSLNEWKPTPEAQAEIHKEAEYFPQDYLANYMTGFLASGERRYGEARPYLEAASKIDPTAPEPALYLGLDAYAEGDMKTAEQMLRKAVELTGKDEARSNYQIRRAYVDLGRILSSSDRKQESEAFLTKARDLQNKTMEQSQQSIAAMAQASGATNNAAVMPLAASAASAASEAGSGTSDFTTSSSGASLGKLTAAQRGEIEQQEKILHGVLGLAFNDLATSEAVQGEYPRALAHYQQAEVWDPSLAGLEKNIGLSAFRGGEYSEAIRAFSQAVREQPENAALRGMLGIAYFNMDQYTKAAEIFSPLGAEGMQDSEVGYAWAASLARTGDLNKASEVLLAFASVPRPKDVMLLIGQLWTAIGDYPRATSTLEQALAADPQLRRAHLYEGLAYIRWEHWPEAARQFEAELALSPDDPDATYHLGFVAMQQSRMDAAVELFEKVIAEYPGYANAQYQLGKILLDRGQIDGAVSHLEAAARSSPQTDYIHYQLQAAYRKQNRTELADQELEKYKQLKAISRDRVAQAAKFNN